MEGGSQIGKEKEDSAALAPYENTCWVKYSVRYSVSREPWHKIQWHNHLLAAPFPHWAWEIWGMARYSSFFKSFFCSTVTNWAKCNRIAMHWSERIVQPRKLHQSGIPFPFTTAFPSISERDPNPVHSNPFFDYLQTICSVPEHPIFIDEGLKYPNTIPNTTYINLSPYPQVPFLIPSLHHLKPFQCPFWSQSHPNNVYTTSPNAPTQFPPHHCDLCQFQKDQTPSIPIFPQVSTLSFTSFLQKHHSICQHLHVPLGYLIPLYIEAYSNVLMCL